MLVQLGKTIWLIGVLGWFVIRYPYARRAKRIAKTKVAHRKRELACFLPSNRASGAYSKTHKHLGEERYRRFVPPPIFILTDTLQLDLAEHASI
jgi:hypothetical protein